MATAYVFSDESGNFDFSGGAGATRYFILATVTGADCQYGDQLLALRRRLAWRGVGLDAMFHATEDHGSVCAEVLATLASAPIRIDVTLFTKANAPPHLRSEDALYAFAWAHHLRGLAPAIVGAQDRLLVVASQLGTKRRRAALHGAVQHAVNATVCRKRRTAFWPNASDPCLWAADYASWAAQRHFERNDPHPRATLIPRIATEEFVWP